MIPCITGCVKAKCLAAPVKCDDGYDPTTQNLILGAVEPDMDYTLYIIDNSSEVFKALPFTSDSEGDITLNMNDYPVFFHPGTTYTLWVTLIGAGVNDSEDITFSAYDIFTCVIIEFATLSNDSETLVGIENQAIEING